MLRFFFPLNFLPEMLVKFTERGEDGSVHFEVESIGGEKSEIRECGQCLWIEIGRPQSPGVDQTDHIFRRHDCFFFLIIILFRENDDSLFIFPKFGSLDADKPRRSLLKERYFLASFSTLLCSPFSV